MGKIMPKTISYSWPGLDNDGNDEKKGFLFSYEVKVSTGPSTLASRSVDIGNAF